MSSSTPTDRSCARSLGRRQQPRGGTGMRLALLTGCRIGEAIGSRRTRLTPRQAMDQTGRDDQTEKGPIVPLQPEALAIAKDLLSARAAGLRRLPAAPGSARGRSSAAQDVRIHDLRHSRASALARGGASASCRSAGCWATPRRRRRRDTLIWSTPIWSTWSSARDDREARTAAVFGGRALAARANGPAHGRRGNGGDAA